MTTNVFGIAIVVAAAALAMFIYTYGQQVVAGVSVALP